MTPFQEVIKRSGARVPFNEERISNAIYRAAVSVGGRDRRLAEQLAAEVIQYLDSTLPDNSIPNVEQIQDAVEKILIENGHARVAKAYILYRDERARIRDQRIKQHLIYSNLIPWPKIWQVLDWASSRNLHTVDLYNQRILAGEISSIVSESEMFYEEDINLAAKAILERRNEVKIVLISGPSSSGKTTTTIKIGQRLASHGLKLTTLNVDNYFFDLEHHPKDEFGDYDFETPQALDLDLINENLLHLSEGKEVLTPRYDFKTGKRQAEAVPMRVEKDEIILIDSLHGLYPEMTRAISPEHKFKIYLEPLLQMKDKKGEYVRWTDVRLLRRMLRDAAYRAYDPEQTLTHWHYVRSSEMRNIIPNWINADFVINSAMPYELSIYKPKLINRFQDWVYKFKDDSLREDALERSDRVLRLLESLEAISDDSIVPGDSVIREFIGGSVLNYH